MTQPELLAEYADRYFDVLDDVWADRELEWAIEFSSQMFPHPCASKAVDERAREVLDRDDLPSPLRRVLAEQLDLQRRILDARATDAA